MAVPAPDDEVNAQDRNIAAAVQLLDSSGNLVGVGSIVAVDQVATAAHVVNGALGEDLGSRIRPAPDRLVRVLIAAPNGDIETIGSVVRWKYSATEDVATLRIENTTHGVEQASPVVPAPELNGLAIRIFAFPQGTGAQGGLLEGTITGKLQRGNLQIIFERTGFPLQRGYSGAFVMDAQSGGVVGMLTDVDPDNWVAWMVRYEEGLRNAPLGKDVRQGSPSWRLIFIVTNALGGLISDLCKDRFRVQGPDEALSGSVQQALAQIAVDFAILAGYAEWRDTPEEYLEGLLGEVVRWASFPPGLSGQAGRSRAVAALRERHREFVKSGIGPIERWVDDEDAADVSENAIDRLEVLHDDHRHSFEGLGKLLRRYHKLVNAYQDGLR